jgi:hypothetical protein
VAARPFAGRKGIALAAAFAFGATLGAIAPHNTSQVNLHDPDFWASRSCV